MTSLLTGFPWNTAALQNIHEERFLEISKAVGRVCSPCSLFKCEIPDFSRRESLSLKKKKKRELFHHLKFIFRFKKSKGDNPLIYTGKYVCDHFNLSWSLLSTCFVCFRFLTTDHKVISIRLMKQVRLSVEGNQGWYTWQRLLRWEILLLGGK